MNKKFLYGILCVVGGGLVGICANKLSESVGVIGLVAGLLILGCAMAFIFKDYQ